MPEVCTPPSEMNSSSQTGADWVSPNFWFAGVAQGTNSARLTVDQTVTPAQSAIANNFDTTQLALIDPLAEITSMTLAFTRRTTRTSIAFPTNFRCFINLGDRGVISTKRSCGSGLENTWEAFSYQWLAWTNTGNAGNKLYGFNLASPANNLECRLEFFGESANVAGALSANGGSLIVCYINPDGGAAQSLQLCEF
jgi:hypothetical protein